MTRTLTYAEVKTGLEEVVAKYGPDTLYKDRFESITGAPTPVQGPLCSNWLHNVDGVVVPACIVGVVLDHLGFPVLDLDGPTAADGTLSELIDQGALDGFEAGVERLLLAVQDKQDTGQPWGPALAQSIEDIENPEYPWREADPSDEIW